MYLMVHREDTVRIPPERLGKEKSGKYIQLAPEEMDELLESLAHSTFEGRMEKGALTLIVTMVERVGEGRIIHGDGGVFQKLKYDAVIFKPDLQEVVHGTVCEVMKFGAFVRFGPLDGLLHVSQIMDDRIDVDETGKRLLGKDTKRELREGDEVRVRIVALSLNERSPKESKIGLTMRQPALGKLDWIHEDRAPKEEKGRPPKRARAAG